MFKIVKGWHREGRRHSKAARLGWKKRGKMLGKKERRVYEIKPIMKSTIKRIVLKALSEKSTPGYEVDFHIIGSLGFEGHIADIATRNRWYFCFHEWTKPKWEIVPTYYK